MITHYVNDSSNGDWLRELVRMAEESLYDITLTTPGGEPIATVDVMTAQDLVEAA